VIEVKRQAVLKRPEAMARLLTHAGGVVFRRRDHETLYLVVSSSDGANWVLPKGHIDPGESAEQAALRELAEEAGVLGAIRDRLSVQTFKQAGREVATQYFLVLETGLTPTAEKRTIRWEYEAAALKLLTFPEARAALLEGVASAHRFGD
jgi:8-oxo-dGTP pyrophosphatase MutT (NUDIX family)